MELYTLLFVFVLSLAFLVLGSDWFLKGAERIGLKFGLSPFAIGVLLVGMGTSMPELVSSIAAVFKGVNEIVVANAVGSNIANILLIIGIIAIVGRKLEVNKNLIELELPLLAVSTILFLAIILDGVVFPMEAAFLLAAYLIYLVYSLKDGGVETISTAAVEKSEEIIKKVKEEEEGLSRFVLYVFSFRDYAIFLLGIWAIYFGAKYLIDSVVGLSQMLSIAPEIISVTAIAFGTSLPELFVSGRAVLSGKSEVAVGNILGSNAFNALIVVGLPGIFTVLPVGEKILSVGVPFMVASTFLFILSGISRRFYHWEGMMFLILYILFIFKLFNVV